MTEKEILERIMTAHWDMKRCDCWICSNARKAGLRPIVEYSSEKLRYAVPPMDDLKYREEQNE